MKKKLLTIIISVVLIFAMAGTCLAWTDSNGNYSTSGCWYSTWRDTSNMRYYWNVGTNIIVTNQTAGLVCCDFGYNPSTNNDFVYSYCLDKYELHVSNMKQVNRGDYWFYATNSAGDSYTLNRSNSYETYGTSLVKRYSLSGTVKYCVEWNTQYSPLTIDSFYF